MSRPKQDCDGRVPMLQSKDAIIKLVYGRRLEMGHQIVNHGKGVLFLLLCLFLRGIDRDIEIWQDSKISPRRSPGWQDPDRNTQGVTRNICAEADVLEWSPSSRYGMYMPVMDEKMAAVRQTTDWTSLPAGPDRIFESCDRTTKPNHTESIMCEPTGFGSHEYGISATTEQLVSACPTRNLRIKARRRTHKSHQSTTFEVLSDS